MMEDLGLGIMVSMKDAFSQNAGRVQSSMQSLDATIAASSQRISHNMELIQQGATVMGAGLALMAAPVGLVASTIGVQKALGEMASLGYQDFETLDKAAEDFTNHYAGFTKEGIVGSSYYIKSALAHLSDEAIAEFAQVASLTAKGTKASVEAMVSTFTTGYGIFKPMMADMTDAEWARAFSGALAQTVQSFKTTGAEMAEAIKNLGATAAIAKVPLNEQLAILGQLQTSMPGTEAGSHYKSFMMHAAAAGEKLGLSFIGPTGQLKGIIPILEEVKRKFPDLSQAAAQMKIKEAFGREEAVQFLLQISQRMGPLARSIDSVGRAMRGGTVLTEQMAQAMNRDLGAQLQLVSQQTKNLTEILGGTLLPLTTPLLQGVQFVVLRMQDWARAHQGLVRGILVSTLGLGALLLVVGAVITVIGSLGLLIPAIQTGLATIGPILLGAMSAVGTSLLPAMLIIAGVIAVVWLLRQAWVTNFAGIRDVLTNAWTSIKAVFLGIAQLITSFNGTTGTMSASIAAQLERAGLYNFVVTVFQVYARVRAFLEGLWQGFSSFFGNIRAAIEPSVTALVRAFVGLFTALGQVFGIAQATKVEVAGTTGSWRQFGQAVGEVLGFVGQVVATVFAGVVWVITGVVQVIRGVVTALGWLRVGMTVVGNFIIRHWNTIAGVVKWAAIVLGTIFGPALIQTGIQATIAGAQIVSNYLMGLQMAGAISLVRTINQLKTIASMSWGNVTGGIQGMVSALRAAGIATAQYAVAGWRAVAALAAQAGQWIVLRVRTLAGIAATLAARGAQLASSIATGIATAVTWAFNAALWANPITWIVVAIIGLIAVVILLWRNWSTVTAWLTGAWQAIKGAAVAVFNWLAGFFRTWGITILAVVAGPIGWIALAIYKNWDAIKGFLSSVWGWMKSAGGAIWNGVKAGASAIGGWCGNAWNGIKSGASQAWEGIKSGVSSYVNFHRGNLELAKNIAIGAWEAIAHGHGSLWDRCRFAASQAVQQISAKYPLLGTAMQVVGATISRVWQYTGMAATHAWSAVRQAAHATWTGITTGLSAIGGWCTTTWQSIAGGATRAWQGMVSGVTDYVTAQRMHLETATTIAIGAWTAIANGHGSLWERCQAVSRRAVSEIAAQYPWLGTAMQTVGATINGVWASISGAASSAWASVKSWAMQAWDGVTNAATSAFQHLTNGFANLLPTALEAGKKLMQALADGITQAALAPFNALKAGLDKLGKLLPHSNAELGPLSTLTQSGFSVLDTMSRGIAKASYLPKQAMQQAFAFGNHLPSVMPLPLAPVMAGDAPSVRPIMPVVTRPIAAASGAGSETRPHDGPVQELLQAILTELRAQGQQDGGDTVVQLDGREIARAVYRDMRERRVRGYENG